MKNESTPDKEMTELSAAITKALAGSGDVIKILNLLKEKNRLQTKDTMVFILKANHLLAVSQQKESPAPEVKPLPAPVNIRPLNDQKEEYIDGKKLSANQIAFEEYWCEQFSEEDWLKSIKIQPF